MDQAFLTLGVLRSFRLFCSPVRIRYRMMKRNEQRAIKKAALTERAAFHFLAEREGFEPSVEFNPHTRLAGEHHRPARSSLHYPAKREHHIKTSIMAEEVGFEPTVLSYNGFQDRRLKPLGHPSKGLSLYHLEKNLSILCNCHQNHPDV